jgi:hypothetical protein
MNTMMNQTFASMFGGVSGIPGADGPGFNPAALLGAIGGAGQGGDMNNEALQNLLAGAGAGEGGGAFNPASMFATMAGMGGAEQAQEVDKSSKYWNLLHLAMMCMLGIYAVYIEWTRAGSERFASLLYSNITAAKYPSVHVVSLICDMKNRSMN